MVGMADDIFAYCVLCIVIFFFHSYNRMFTTTTSTQIIENEAACPVCGTFANTGERSCCASGGTWFQKCGNANDPNANHTWTEGIEVCKETSPPGKSTYAHNWIKTCVNKKNRESPTPRCVSLAVATNQSSICALATNHV